MANDECLKILKRGVGAWNEWRDAHPLVKGDFSDADLTGMKLHHANLDSANLSRANLSRAELTYASLGGARLCGVNLYDTYLYHTDLSGAYLNNANLRGLRSYGVNFRSANFSHADLTYARLIDANMTNAKLGGAELNGVFLDGANLTGAELAGVDVSHSSLFNANFSYANLSGANLAYTSMLKTILAGVNLSQVIGLERVSVWGPCEVSVSTIYLSQGKIPEEFLRECAVPDELIINIPSLVTAMNPIQFSSCFLSYSGKDEEFARRLRSRLRDAGIRVWFAPEDVKGGEKLYEQITHAIQIHDRLLLVLSEHSLKSEWVMTEIRRARKVEMRENRRKLFPIRLVDYATLRDWECFDPDSGKDLAVEVREYFIPDFSNWKSYDDFEREFARLLNDLKVGGSDSSGTSHPYVAGPWPPEEPQFAWG